ncbi:MAG: winged helix DNA-binding protein [Clostridiales bacterium]|nr:winged helix DNA-binding protein [Clostridiales bacterium]
MSIERILRGGKFKKLLEKTMADAKNKTNLNRVELEVIYLLFHYDDVTTLTDICQYTQMNKGHMSTTLDNLVKKGYVVCKRDEKDRRYVKYQLTEASEQIRMEIDGLWSELLSKIVSGIDEESLKVFNQVAKQINENIDYLLENE